MLLWLGFVACAVEQPWIVSCFVVSSVVALTKYNPAMAWQDRISVNSAIRSGKPCINGTRITVYDVLEYLAGGMAEDQILSDFPDLTLDDIRAALAFAAARERRLANSVA